MPVVREIVAKTLLSAAKTPDPDAASTVAH